MWFLIFWKRSEEIVTKWLAEITSGEWVWGVKNFLFNQKILKFFNIENQLLYLKFKRKRENETTPLSPYDLRYLKKKRHLYQAKCPTL